MKKHLLAPLAIISFAAQAAYVEDCKQTAEAISKYHELRIAGKNDIATLFESMVITTMSQQLPPAHPDTAKRIQSAKDGFQFMRDTSITATMQVVKAMQATCK